MPELVAEFSSSAYLTDTQLSRFKRIPLAWRRQVSLSDRIRSTQRLPLVLAVPKDRFRHRTPHRKALSARLLVGSTPWWARKTHSESISRSRRRANRPASSGQS